MRINQKDHKDVKNLLSLTTLKILYHLPLKFYTVYT